MKQQTPEQKMREFYNLKMVGKRVFVTDFGGYYGDVESVSNDTFYVRQGDKLNKVNIHDIRST